MDANDIFIVKNRDFIDKIIILIRNCCKWTEHTVYFSHGTISLKWGRMLCLPPGRWLFPASFVFAVVPYRCLCPKWIISNVSRDSLYYIEQSSCRWGVWCKFLWASGCLEQTFMYDSILFTVLRFAMVSKYNYHIFQFELELWNINLCLLKI